MASETIDADIAAYFSDDVRKEPDMPGLINAMRLKFGLQLEEQKIGNLNKPALKEELYGELVRVYAEKEKSLGEGLLRHLERMVFLQMIDSKWKDHLYAMDSLREGIGLRAYGQRDPLVEYKREAFDMFSQMISSIREETVEAIFKLQAAKPERFKGAFSVSAQELIHPEAVKFERPQEEEVVDEGIAGVMPPKVSLQPVQSTQPKVGRNDPCPCGSGKKYKKCHGR